jgi:small subunit ribosomal protein S2
MSDLPTVKQLRDWGAHFGHLRKVMHPSFKPYVLEVREKIVLIDPQKSISQLKKAIDFLKKNNDKSFLWVGTKVIVKNLVEEVAKELGHAYITEKWLGGMLTNFETSKKNLQTMESLKSQEASEEFKELTKKEKGIITKKREKLEKVLVGLANLKQIPDIMIVVDPNFEHIAISEAKTKGLKVVGLCDVSSNLWQIDYPIPMNDDSRLALTGILEILAKTFQSDFKFKKDIKVKKS